MFHGQYLRRVSATSTASHTDYRVDGQNTDDDGSNLRAQVLQCPSYAPVWYPGWDDPSNSWEGMHYQIPQLGYVLRSSGILTADTFAGLWDDGVGFDWDAGERERASFVPGGGLYQPDTSLTGNPNPPIGNVDIPDDGVI